MKDIKLKTIVIDDEQDSVDAIESILNDYCSNVELLGKYTNPAIALKEIKEKEPNLIFLDVEMPHMNGFQLLESIQERNFDVVFITAYSHYAVNAFKVSAVDYILKPINISELINAVDKVYKRQQKNIVERDNFESLFNNLKSLQKKKVSLPTQDGTEFVEQDDIIKIEADGSYSKIHFISRKAIVVSKNLKELEEIIDSSAFFRPHKSYIINITHIKKYNLQIGGEIELVDGTKVVISRRKKDEFVKRVEAFFK